MIYVETTKGFELKSKRFSLDSCNYSRRLIGFLIKVVSLHDDHVMDDQNFMLAYQLLL